GDGGSHRGALVGIDRSDVLVGVEGGKQGDPDRCLAVRVTKVVDEPYVPIRLQADHAVEELIVDIDDVAGDRDARHELGIRGETDLRAERSAGGLDRGAVEGDRADVAG